MSSAKSPLPCRLRFSAARFARALTRGGVILIGSVVLARAADTIKEEPLAVRSGPRGATMFAVLPPEQTGVITENRYADPKMWSERYQEFAYGSIGTGVAIADYDNDGRPDLFVTSKTEGCRLFRNLGNWKFEDVTERAGLRGVTGSSGASEPWQQGATFVDVNNDGLLDVYVCRFGAPNLLYINQGNGTFKEEGVARGLAVIDASVMAAFCDYDRDGWLDVYIATNMLDATTHPKGQRGYLFHNNRDGTFTNVTERAEIAGETLSHSATWWDYDNDGWPDLYVANDYAAPDRLYHNNHDGTFTDMINQTVPRLPYYAMGSDLGDVNNDGLIDFFVADMATTTHEKDQRGMANSRLQAELPPTEPGAVPQLMHNALFLNTGTGSCLEAAFLTGLAATDWTWSVRFEDLDNDGRLDLHVTNGMVREYHSVDLLGRVMAATGPLDSRQIAQASPKLVERHLAFRNVGDLQFEDVSAAWGLDQKGVSFGAAFGDLDGDGDLDLVYANYEKGVTVLRNDSDTGHRILVALRGAQSNRFGVGATVRIETKAGVQVRPLVLARGYLSSSEPVLHFGLGDETHIQRLSVEWPSGQTQTFTDLEVDRKFVITEPAGPASRPPSLPPQPSGQFTEVKAPPARPEQLPEGAKSGDVIAAADFNRDGKVDVFVGGRMQPGKYPRGSRSGLRVNRGDHFEEVTDTVAPGLKGVGLVTAALWSDVDGDGWLDLLVAVEWGSIRYFHNHEGQILEDWTEKAGFSAGGTGWWTALATADFNGDGRPDYVAGNVGLNTPYHASPERPAMAFLGQFSESGGPMLIEAYYEGNRLFPWRTRKELGSRIPSILKRYPKNDLYARATLGEIVGEDRLAAAKLYKATELRSGVFLSRPDGTYRFAPLPRLAQIAPLQGIVAGDFDGDGHADIYAVQSSHAPLPVPGQFYGGLSQLLRGDGQGNFTAVAPAESELIAKNDAQTLTVLDLDEDGWPDFLITRDNGASLAYRNQGVAGRHSLRVVLHGAAGNQAAIGARVTLDLADGTTQTAEITTGADFLSHSAATCFFGFSATNQPRRLRVRWPDGSFSSHDVTSSSATTEILNQSAK